MITPMFDMHTAAYNNLNQKVSVLGRKLVSALTIIAGKVLRQITPEKIRSILSDANGSIYGTAYDSI